MPDAAIAKHRETIRKSVLRKALEHILFRTREIVEVTFIIFRFLKKQKF